MVDAWLTTMSTNLEAIVYVVQRYSAGIDKCTQGSSGDNQ